MIFLIRLNLFHADVTNVVKALQSSSSSRRTAGAAGFLILSQWLTRPDRYGEPSRFDTMPSQPSVHACLWTIAPIQSGPAGGCLAGRGRQGSKGRDRPGGNRRRSSRVTDIAAKIGAVPSESSFTKRKPRPDQAVWKRKEAQIIQGHLFFFGGCRPDGDGAEPVVGEDGEGHLGSGSDCSGTSLECAWTACLIGRAPGN